MEVELLFRTPQLKRNLKVSRQLLLAIGFLMLSLALIAQPANDEPASAIALTLNAAGVSATTSGATDSSLDLCDAGFNDEDDDIFFTFVAPASGNVSVDLANASGTGQFPAFSILSGSPGSLACFDFSYGTSGSFTGLSSGSTYYLQVYSFLEDPSAVTFDVKVFETASAPDNDECAAAQPLTIGSPASGTLNAATESFEDPCAGGIANDDVWYSFVATATESSVYINRTGGSNDGLRLGVHTGACGALSNIGCNTGAGESLHLTGLTISQTYYVQVFSNLTTGASTTEFEVEVVVPPSNDKCSNATAIACGASQTASYRGSTPDGSSCVTRGVWFTVTGTGGGMTITASPDANNDVALQVYSGSCGSLSEIVCEDSGIEGEDDSFAFLSLAGETYYIYAGESSFLDDNEGSFTLSVTCNALIPIASAVGCDNTVNDVTMTGSGDWLPIILGASIVGKIMDTEALGLTTISLYGNTGALRTSGGTPLADRNITINPTNAPSLTIPVRLFFSSAEIDALIAADPTVSSIADLEYTKVSGTSCSGPYPGGGIQLLTTAYGNYGTDYFVQTSVAAFSEFFLSSASAPLPVELASFTAFAKTGATQVKWETASEKNVDYFRVERSQNGYDFIELGEVDAVGESSTLQSYSFTDTTPLDRGYYRLVSVDLDGSSSTSYVVFVEQVLAKALEINVYPNPTSDVLNVRVSTNAIVQLLDPTGRVVAELEGVDGLVQFQTASMPKGLYFVRVLTGGSVESSQVILK